MGLEIHYSPSMGKYFVYEFGQNQGAAAITPSKNGELVGDGTMIHGDMDLAQRAIALLQKEREIKAREDLAEKLGR